MVASVLSMAKTISRPIPSRLWNQFKFLFNCTHFCPIIRRVPKKISQLYHRTPLHGRPLVIRDRFCCPGEMSSYEDDALFLQFFRLWLHQPLHHGTVHPNLSFPYVLCCSAWLHIPLLGCLNLHSKGSKS